MKKKRIIPVVLLKNGWVVQSKNFLIHQNIGNALNSVKRFSEWGSDELIYLDISRDDTYNIKRNDQNYKNINNIIEILENVSKVSFMPITVGGKIRSLNDIHIRLKAGADKVSINSYALKNKNFIYESAKEFGSQCVVVSIDVKKIDNKYFVFSNFGLTNTNILLLDWCKIIEDSGAGEILLNSIDRDGTKQGYDLELLNLVSNSIKIPIIALGGVGEWSHIAEAMKNTNVDGFAASNIFHHYDQSVYLARKYLYDKQYNVRKPMLLDL